MLAQTTCGLLLVAFFAGAALAYEDVVPITLCSEAKGAVDPSKVLKEKNLIISMYHGELASCDTESSLADQCDAPAKATVGDAGAWEGTAGNWFVGGSTQVGDDGDTGPWTGYDVELFDAIRKAGQFSYTIRSLGSAASISEGEGYTATQKVAEESQGVMMTGQGTWRVNQDRLRKGYLWGTNPVSEEVLFVTRDPDKSAGDGLFGGDLDDHYFSRAGYIFEPFRYTVWGMLIGITVMFLFVLICITRKVQRGGEETSLFSDVDTSGGGTDQMEIDGHEGDVGIFDLTYYTCISLAAEHNFESNNSWFLKVVILSWVLFIFVITAIYTAGLTSFLALDSIESTQVTSVTEVVEQGKTFCVNRGSANAQFFTSDERFSEMAIYSTSGISGQIDCVLPKKKGRRSDCSATREGFFPAQSPNISSCDAIELTREDVFLWAKDQTKKSKCDLNVMSDPIVTRQRGMMAPKENMCLLAAVNSLYYTLHVSKDAVTLHDKWFPDVDCAVVDTADGHEPMHFKEIVGVWAVLALFTCGTLSVHFCRNRKQCCCYAESKKHWNLSWEEAGFRIRKKKTHVIWPSTNPAPSGYYVEDVSGSQKRKKTGLRRGQVEGDALHRGEAENQTNRDDNSGNSGPVTLDSRN